MFRTGGEQPHNQWNWFGVRQQYAMCCCRIDPDGRRITRHAGQLMFTRLPSHLGRFRRDTRGVAAVEFALLALLFSTGIFNAFDIGRYAYQRVQVSDAAYAGAQAAWKTCNDQTTMLPATQHCPGLNAAVTSSVQSTSLGTSVALSSAGVTEGYYCVNASSTLQLVGGLSSKPPIVLPLETQTSHPETTFRSMLLLATNRSFLPPSCPFADLGQSLRQAGCARVRACADTLKNCSRGTAAVEFSWVAPCLFLLLTGIVYAGLLVYSAMGMQTAVETAARCYSVNSAQCSGASTTQILAQKAYFGVSRPTFTASTPSCGHQVSAALTFSVGWSIPLTATACFP